MKKINAKNKICIYLDQFVISDIIEGKNPLWIEIKELLEDNHSKGKIYCPLSIEHMIETVKKDLESATNHDAYFRKLSDNYLLKSEPFLTCQLISSLIRKNNLTSNTFLKNEKIKDIKDIYSQINKNNSIFDESITFKLSYQNDLKRIVNPNVNKKTEFEIIKTIKNLQVDSFKNRLEEYINTQIIQIRPDNYGKYSLPNWIDQILYQLTKKHQFKDRQFKQLLLELKKHGFDKIQTLNTRFSMAAYLSAHSKQLNVGDYIDIMRISSYMFSTDIFFTDKKRKYEILELGLDKKYNTKILSGSEKDLSEVISLLKSI